MSTGGKLWGRDRGGGCNGEGIEKGILMESGKAKEGRGGAS